jgi:HSP20 family protein
MVKRTARFYGPIVELSRLQGELNRLFAAFVETNNRTGAPVGTSWDPNVDVLDDGEAIRILAELPGVEPGDVKVSIRGKVLMIRGTKKGRIRTREGMRFFCMERYFGGFVKSVPLPRPVNSHHAKTRMKHGLLEVVLPRVPDLREKEIEIPVSQEPEE